MVQSGRDVHDSEDAIVSEIRILLQLSEWKYIVPLLLKAFVHRLVWTSVCARRLVKVLLLISWYFNYSDVA